MKDQKKRVNGLTDPKFTPVLQVNKNLLKKSEGTKVLDGDKPFSAELFRQVAAKRGVSKSVVELALKDKAFMSLVSKGKVHKAVTIAKGAQSQLSKVASDSAKFSKALRNVTPGKSAEDENEDPAGLKVKIGEMKKAARKKAEFFIQDAEQVNTTPESDLLFQFVKPLASAKMSLLKRMSRLPGWIVGGLEEKDAIQQDLEILDKYSKQVTSAGVLGSLQALLKPVRSYFYAGKVLDYDSGMKLKAEALVNKLGATPNDDSISYEKRKPEPDVDFAPVMPVIHFSSKFLELWASVMGCKPDDLKTLFWGSDQDGGKINIIKGVDGKTNDIVWEQIDVDYKNTTGVMSEVHAMEVYKPLYDEIIAFTKQIMSELKERREVCYQSQFGAGGSGGVNLAKTIATLIFDTYGRVLMEQYTEILPEVLKSLANDVNSFRTISAKSLTTLLALCSKEVFNDPLGRANRALSLYNYHTLPKMYSWMKNLLQVHEARFESKQLEYFLESVSVGRPNFVSRAHVILGLPFTEKLFSASAAGRNTDWSLGDSFQLDTNTQEYVKGFSFKHQSLFALMLQRIGSEVKAATDINADKTRPSTTALEEDARFTMMGSAVAYGAKDFYESTGHWDGVVSIDQEKGDVDIAGLFNFIGSASNTLNGLFEEFNYSGVYRMVSLLPALLQSKDASYMVNKTAFLVTFANAPITRWRGVNIKEQVLVEPAWKSCLSWLENLPKTFDGVTFNIGESSIAGLTVKTKYLTKEKVSTEWDNGVMKHVEIDRASAGLVNEEFVANALFNNNGHFAHPKNDSTYEDFIPGVRTARDMSAIRAASFYRYKYPVIFLPQNTNDGFFNKGDDAVILSMRVDSERVTLQGFKSSIVKGKNGVLQFWSDKQFEDMDMVSEVIDYIYGIADVKSRQSSVYVLLNTTALLRNYTGMTLSPAVSETTDPEALMSFLKHFNIPTLQANKAATSLSVNLRGLQSKIGVDAGLVGSYLARLTTKVVDYDKARE